MHIYFSGIGGAGLGPLALIAKQAGYEVSGSDKQQSSYTEYLQSHGVTNIATDVNNAGHIQAIHAQQPIDWFVYSSAVVKENPDHPELLFCHAHNIKTTKRDELITQILQDKQLKMIAVAGTHGKTTTTAMAIWLFKQLDIPVSYAVGAKLSFGDAGEFVEGSEYFVYEADEYDRNFLAFHPEVSVIPGIDWDHADIYPTREEYYQAFRDFLAQSQQKVMWHSDIDRLGTKIDESFQILDEDSPETSKFVLPGLVNRQNAYQVVMTLQQLTGKPLEELVGHMNKFLGVSRRFERIAKNVYSDYAHTPEKIRGALQLANEVAGDNIVVVYEGLHNTRQHFIKEELAHLFDDVKKLYVVPSYLAREDESLEMLTPEKLIALTSQPDKAEPKQLDEDLRQTIEWHQKSGDLVLCLTAGGGNSLDEWLRRNFLSPQQ
jgi:UDP-N-acetylmuramate--alanine ligase